MPSPVEISHKRKTKEGERIVVTTAHTKRLSGAFLAFATFIGLSVAGSAALADEKTAVTSANIDGCSTTVVVKKSINLSSDITLNEGCSIKRAKSFTGPIFIVKDATVTITGNGATIDGRNVSANAPLIAVDNSTVTLKGLTIQGGHNSTDNRAAIGETAAESVPTDTWAGMGGALGARSSTVTIENSTLTENQATLGGAIFVEGTTLNLNDGAKVDGNKAVWDGADQDSTGINAHVKRSYAAGGAVMATSARGLSTINVKSGASLSNNKAPAGGAIALGRNHTNETLDQFGYLTLSKDSYIFNVGAQNTQVNISGGEFKNNTAESAGGAIFVQANTTATITGGEFTGNTAQAQGRQDFSGGAIYVQEAKTNIPAPGRLILVNALIEGNSAKVNGGGIAFCATGDGFVGSDSGASIFDNTSVEDSDNGKNDVSVRVRTASRNKLVSLSSEALGGVENKWSINDPSNITQNTPVIVNNLTDKENARNGAQVIFKGNISESRGGALGVNGALELGKQNAVFYIKKVDSITRETLAGAEFTLTGNGYTETATTPADGLTAFRNLVPGEYTLTETEAPEGYTAHDSPWTVTVANDLTITVKNVEGTLLTATDTISEAHGRFTFDVYELENTPGVPKGEEVAIHTTATDNADGDKTVDADKIEVKDVVAYENLMPGKEYTVKGKLVVKGTNGKDVVAEAQAKFTPTDKNGEVVVIFSADATELAGKELVVYEYLFESDVTGENIDLDTPENDARFVTKHADDNDAAQTVKVKEKKPTPPPTKSVKLPITGLPKSGSTIGMPALAMALLISGGVILLRRRWA